MVKILLLIVLHSQILLQLLSTYMHAVMESKSYQIISNFVLEEKLQNLSHFWNREPKKNISIFNIVIAKIWQNLKHFSRALCQTQSLKLLGVKIQAKNLLQ